MSRHPTEARADLQRYFGIDLDDVDAGRVSVFQAASCLASVPLGSSVARCVDVRATWGHESHLLHAILSAIAGKEVPYPWEKHDSGLGNESMDVDEFLQWYGQDWKDDDECQTL